jgi:hypothetical protein
MVSGGTRRSGAPDQNAGRRGGRPCVEGVVGESGQRAGEYQGAGNQPPVGPSDHLQSGLAGAGPTEVGTAWRRYTLPVVHARR